MMNRPTVTTLCGSSRFPDAFALSNMHLSMIGRVVISLGCFGHADYPIGARHLTSDGDETTPEKQHLDQLHFRKIDISDGIFVVNPGGYIGASTKREIAYAQSLGKTVEWLFQPSDAASADLNSPPQPPHPAEPRSDATAVPEPKVMAPSPVFRAGDVVVGEGRTKVRTVTWADPRSGRFSWFGAAPGEDARTAEFVMIHQASDEGRRDSLLDLKRSGGPDAEKALRLYGDPEEGERAELKMTVEGGRHG